MIIGQNLSIARELGDVVAAENDSIAGACRQGLIQAGDVER